MFGLGKTLTLIIKVFLVCLSQFCSFVLKLIEVVLFWLKFFGEKGKKSPNSVQALCFFAYANLKPNFSQSRPHLGEGYFT